MRWKQPNICCVKSEDAVDYRTVTRWSKKLCKNLNDQVMIGKPKTVNYNAVFDILQFSVIRHLTTSIVKLLTHPSRK